MGWDDQMTSIQTIDQVHVPSEDDEASEDGVGWSDEGYSNN